MPIEAQARAEREGSAGPFYGWWRGWALPTPATRPGGGVTIETTLAHGPLADLPASVVGRRLDDGHVPFVLRVGGELAAYGWSATRSAHIGGLDLALSVAPDERYLWDFVTLPPFRGRGLYPLLLQEVLRRQTDDAEWFWIGHEPGNLASRRGILKAGFRLAGVVWRLRAGGLAFAAATESGTETALGAARILGLRLLDTPDRRAE